MTHEDFNNEFDNMVVATILDRWIDFFHGGDESGEVKHTFNDAKDKDITYEISIGFDFNTREWWGGVFIEGCPGNRGGGLCPSVYKRPCDGIDAIKDRIWEMISKVNNN